MTKVGKVTGIGDREFDLHSLDTVRFDLSENRWIEIILDERRGCLCVTGMGIGLPSLVVIPEGGTNSASLWIRRQQDEL